MSSTSQDRSGARPLVVIFHGLGGGGSKSADGESRDGKMADVIGLAKRCFEGAEIHAPRLPYTRARATVRAAEVVLEQIQAIGKLCADEEKRRKGGFREIVLIGHSMGAVIARRVLVEAAGLESDAAAAREPVDGEDLVSPPALERRLARLGPQPWAHKVSRLVLLAGMSRGWSLDDAKSGLQRLYWRLGAVYGHLKFLGRKPTLFDMRRGATFIVQTRLRWMVYRKSHPEVQVIQLLGTVDPVVSPDDSVDYVNASGKGNFLLAEVPASNHGQIVRLGPRRFDRQPPVVYETRERILRAALLGELAELAEHEVRRSHLDDELPPPPDSSVEDVVFVIHGIRDRGYWTKRIAARVKALAERTGRTFVSRTPAYGYFPILPFVLPWVRLQKVEWLMDHYVEARASYPEARFHYMGHSNGTYLCARALMDYPEAEFRRIMFAGSVVRQDYPWRRFITVERRVDKVYNAIATRDLVVALFPNGLRWIRAFDLGGAGHEGFRSPQPPEVFQLDYAPPRYVRGGHSAGRQESQWDEIAEFIVEGRNPGPDNPDFERSQPWWIRAVGKTSPLWLTVFVAGLAGVAALILAPLVANLRSPGPFDLGLWLTRAGWFVVYGTFLRFLFLRF